MTHADASVLVIGAGALGSPVAMYLAGAGVGRLGILDCDVVELASLHRQFLHFAPDEGVPRALSAAAKLEFLNPEIVVEPYQVRLDADNARGLVGEHDLVVDASNNPATRLGVNAACCAERVDLVTAEVVGGQGFVMAIRPGETACYRCAFPAATPDPPHAGVSGPDAGVVGSLQARAALAILGAAEAPPSGLDQIDLRVPAITRVAVARRLDCRDCG